MITEEAMDVDLNNDQTQYYSTEVSLEQGYIPDIINDDLAISDSDEEDTKHNTLQEYETAEPGAIWF